MQGQDYMENRIGRIEEKVDRILSLLGDETRTVTIEEIARMAKCSRSALYHGKRYLLPDFGVGLGKGRRYTRAEVSLWLARGEDELRREWREWRECGGA